MIYLCGFRLGYFQLGMAVNRFAPRRYEDVTQAIVCLGVELSRIRQNDSPERYPAGMGSSCDPSGAEGVGARLVRIAQPGPVEEGAYKEWVIASGLSALVDVF